MTPNSALLTDAFSSYALRAAPRRGWSLGTGTPKSWRSGLAKLLNSTYGEERTMPEVIIELAEGRSVELKRRLVKEITEVVVRVCDVDPQAVIVIIHTNPKTDKAKGGVLFCDR